MFRLSFPIIISAFNQGSAIIAIRPYFVLPLILLLGGCATTSGYVNPKDPFEKVNRKVYAFNDTVDKAVLKPVARGYVYVMPRAGRIMANNFFSNLGDVVVTANDLLQLKLKQAISDGGRFLINSTIGILGLADPATSFGLPKHNEDFGQTLGYWGVQPGPYLVLPFLGPSDVRDASGLYMDSLVSPSLNINPARTRNEIFMFNFVRVRANLLADESLINEAALDPYSFMRDAYLSHRKTLVYDGHPPMPRYDDYEDDNDVPPPPAKPAAPVSTSAKPAASAVPAVPAGK